ncbi:DUF4252 domain-containing protein [Prevotella sp. 10(H)]|uniref:DUF4252 domain-containing protein n=1 Tax=Prevotella sp. 10(H) TaxID=1158294 RepID=UPI0004A77696|nr:DUF4252 domain-containing protein [Prevotella sp. 10(H)]
MTNFKSITLPALFCIITLLFSSAIQAQEPVDKLISKYKNTKGFTSAISTKEQMKTIKSMAHMVGGQQGKILMQTDESCYIEYKGKNPNLDKFYQEAIDLFRTIAGHTEIDTNESDIVGKAFVVKQGNICKEISVVVISNKKVTIFSTKGNFEEEALKTLQESAIKGKK